MPAPRTIIVIGLMSAIGGLAIAFAARAEEPVVRVTHDEARDATQIHASMEIAAPPAAVYAVISQCEGATRFVPNLVSCHVVQRDPAGRWDIRVTEFSPMVFLTLRTRTRNDYEPNRRVGFRLIDGDMRISEGAWQLTPIDNGARTRATYDATFALNVPAPRFMIDQTASRDLPVLLRNVARAALEHVARCGQAAQSC